MLVLKYTARKSMIGIIFPKNFSRTLQKLQFQIVAILKKRLTLFFHFKTFSTEQTKKTRYQVEKTIENTAYFTQNKLIWV